MMDATTFLVGMICGAFLCGLVAILWSESFLPWWRAREQEKNEKWENDWDEYVDSRLDPLWKRLSLQREEFYVSENYLTRQMGPIEKRLDALEATANAKSRRKKGKRR